MEILSTGTDLDTFFSQLSSSQHRILLLDYDGTLAPFQLKRDEAVPYSGVRERLSQLVAHSDRTRTVIISGRFIRDLKPLIGLERLPEIWGSHGAERLTVDGDYELADIGDDARRLLNDIEEWGRSRDYDDQLERKPISVAFHWRSLNSDAAVEMKSSVLDTWNERISNSDLTLHEFDGGLEIRVAGITKAQAVLTILDEADSSAVAAYLGDDLTDEDAFRALYKKGLRVLVRAEKRETAADVWLQPPDELLWFLDRWLQAVGAGEQ